MKKILILTMSSFIICSSLDAFSKNNQIEKKSGQWYEGGTLYGVSKKDWLGGTYANRLATSSDFVAHGYNKKMFNISINNMEDLKKYSIQLEECITTGFKRNKSNDVKVVNEAGVMCAYLLNWVK